MNAIQQRTNMPTAPTDNISSWDRYYADLFSTEQTFSPSETLLKVLFGSYLERKIELDAGASVVDVGCGAGANLVHLARRGFDVCGVEVTENAAQRIREHLANQGTEIDVRAGHNRALPIESNSVDLLISINVLHYEKDHSDLLAALDEYRRVIKPNGALYLSTVGPEHEIRSDARPLGNHRYQIQSYDFRDGQTYVYFDCAEALRTSLESAFTNVEIGRVTERLMTRNLDFFIAVARPQQQA